MSWEKILKIDFKEARELTDTYLPNIIDTKIFDARKRSEALKARRNRAKNKLLRFIEEDMDELESLGEWPQKEKYRNKYKKLKREVFLSKPWTYNTQPTTRTSNIDPYIYYLKQQNIFRSQLKPIVMADYTGYKA